LRKRVVKKQKQKNKKTKSKSRKAGRRSKLFQKRPTNALKAAPGAGLCGVRWWVCTLLFGAFVGGVAEIFK
jgi:hypothetical protein